MAQNPDPQDEWYDTQTWGRSSTPGLETHHARGTTGAIPPVYATGTEPTPHPQEYVANNGSFSYTQPTYQDPHGQQVTVTDSTVTIRTKTTTSPSDRRHQPPNYLAAQAQYPTAPRHSIQQPVTRNHFTQGTVQEPAPYATHVPQPWTPYVQGGQTQSWNPVYPHIHTQSGNRQAVPMPQGVPNQRPNAGAPPDYLKDPQYSLCNSSGEVHFKNYNPLVPFPEGSMHQPNAVTGHARQPIVIPSDYFMITDVKNVRNDMILHCFGQGVLAADFQTKITAVRLLYEGIRTELGDFIYAIMRDAAFAMGLNTNTSRGQRSGRLLSTLTQYMKENDFNAKNTHLWAPRIWYIMYGVWEQYPEYEERLIENALKKRNLVIRDPVAVPGGVPPFRIFPNKAPKAAKTVGKAFLDARGSHQRTIRDAVKKMTGCTLRINTGAENKSRPKVTFTKLCLICPGVRDVRNQDAQPAQETLMEESRKAHYTEPTTRPAAGAAASASVTQQGMRTLPVTAVRHDHQPASYTRVGNMDMDNIDPSGNGMPTRPTARDADRLNPTRRDDPNMKNALQAMQQPIRARGEPPEEHPHTHSAKGDSQTTADNSNDWHGFASQDSDILDATNLFPDEGWDSNNLIQEEDSQQCDDFDTDMAILSDEEDAEKTGATKEKRNHHNVRTAPMYNAKQTETTAEAEKDNTVNEQPVVPPTTTAMEPEAVAQREHQQESTAVAEPDETHKKLQAQVSVVPVTRPSQEETTTEDNNRLSSTSSKRTSQDRVRRDSHHERTGTSRPKQPGQDAPKHVASSTEKQHQEKVVVQGTQRSTEKHKHGGNHEVPAEKTPQSSARNSSTQVRQQIITQTPKAHIPRFSNSLLPTPHAATAARTTVKTPRMSVNQKTQPRPVMACVRQPARTSATPKAKRAQSVVTAARRPTPQTTAQPTAVMTERELRKELLHRNAIDRLVTKQRELEEALERERYQTMLERVRANDNQTRLERMERQMDLAEQKAKQRMQRLESQLAAKDMEKEKTAQDERIMYEQIVSKVWMALHFGWRRRRINKGVQLLSLVRLLHSHRERTRKRWTNTRKHKKRSG